MQKPAVVHFPKAPLAVAISVVMLSVVAVGAARIAGLSPVQELGAAEVLQSRTLRFEDATDGSVRIIDNATGRQIASAKPGTNGFLRGALRGLMRVRKRGDISYGAAYRLERWSNGQLMLIDTAEDVKIDLNAYGHTNAAVFNAFLFKSGDQS